MTTKSLVTVHRTVPQGELKAVQEVRQMGGKATPPPMESRRRAGTGNWYRVPMARGYICTREHMPSGKYIRNVVGKCQSDEMRQLYRTAQNLQRENRAFARRAKEAPSFELGEIVTITDAGPFNGHSGPVVKIVSTRMVKVQLGLIAPAISVFKLARVAKKQVSKTEKSARKT